MRCRHTPPLKPTLVTKIITGLVKTIPKLCQRLSTFWLHKQLQTSHLRHTPEQTWSANANNIVGEAGDGLRLGGHGICVPHPSSSHSKLNLLQEIPMGLGITPHSEPGRWAGNLKGMLCIFVLIYISVVRQNLHSEACFGFFNYKLRVQWESKEASKHLKNNYKGPLRKASINWVWETN